MSGIAGIAQFNPLAQLSKALSGVEQMMAGASQCLKKLAGGDLIGAMCEMMKIGKGANKAMEGLGGGGGGGAPGMQMDPMNMLKQLLGLGGQEGGGGGGGGGASPTSLLDGLPKMLQDMMGLQHSLQNMQSMMRAM